MIVNRAASGADRVAFNERQARPRRLLVPHVLVAEEVEQRDLLHVNALSEEKPAGDDVEDEAERVGEDDLRAQRPVEPTDVRRMPGALVDAIRHQFVVVGLLELNLKSF